MKEIHYRYGSRIIVEFHTFPDIFKFSRIRAYCRHHIALCIGAAGHGIGDVRCARVHGPRTSSRETGPSPFPPTPSRSPSLLLVRSRLAQRAAVLEASGAGASARAHLANDLLQ